MAKLTRAQVASNIGFAKAFTRNRTEYHLLVLKDGRPALGWSDDRFCGEQEAYYDAFDKASALLNEGREDGSASQEDECNAKVEEAKYSQGEIGVDVEFGNGRILGGMMAKEIKNQPCSDRKAANDFLALLEDFAGAMLKIAQKKDV